MARTLLLDEAGDLAVSGGALVFATDAQAVVQAVRSRLLTFRGEWYLDLGYGVPYFEDVLVKNPNLPAIAATLRAQILSVPGVLEIVSFSFDYLGTRELRVNYVATSDFGELRAVVEVPI